MEEQDFGMESFSLGANFGFSGVGVDDLAEVASEFTLVTIVRDITYSLEGYEVELQKLVHAVIESCQHSARAENLMMRQIDFNQDIHEVNGFKPLTACKLDDYPAPRCNGMTALFDATFSGVAATVEYAETLMEQDLLTNGIVVIITDGDDNRSKKTPAMIRDYIEKARKSETQIESLLTILVGIGDAPVDYLDNFRNEAGIDQFVDAGDVTASSIAKLAGFISKSVSSQSNSLGTGGPSQPISF